MSQTYELYVRHEGTITIAGATQAAAAAAKAVHALKEGKLPVELISIGANAGSVAARAAVRIVEFFNKDCPNANASVAFVPFFRDSMVQNPDGTMVRKTILVQKVVLVRN